MDGVRRGLTWQRLDFPIRYDDSVFHAIQINKAAADEKCVRHTLK